MKKFYTYIDYTNDGMPFYVGKGDCSRVENLKRNRKHNFVAQKYGQVRKIILETFDEPVAFNREIELIAELKLNFCKHPENSLACNFTDGGDGPAGYRHTEQAKHSMSEKRLGMKRGPWSEERKVRQSRDKKEKYRLGYIKTWNKGVPWSEEVRKKISENRTGIKHSEETRAKIAATQIGHIMRNETACRKVMADIYLIAQRVMNGETQISIQKEYGVSKSFLYRQLKKHANEKGV